jgi:hypothetical protein
MTKLTKAQLEDAVKDGILKEYQEPTEINVNEIGFDMPEGKAMYASFKVPEDTAEGDAGATRDDFCYALVQPDGTCKLFDDGEQLVRFFQDLLDRKRSLWQRFNELNFNDLIGAFIALAIIGSFTFLVIHASWIKAPPEAWISKEFLAIVSVVLGFYFGRNPKVKE